MTDVNYVGSVVKILEKPVQTVSPHKMVRTDCRVQLVQIRSIQIAHLVFWGTLGHDIANNYQVNNYIMIEGYLSLPHQKINKFLKRPVKKAQITVRKIYSIEKFTKHN